MDPFLVVTVCLVYVVLGDSQAMKAAWIEDLLSFTPPLAFLIAVRVSRLPPTRRHPYGLHRSIGVAHLVRRWRWSRWVATWWSTRG